MAYIQVYIIAVIFIKMYHSMKCHHSFHPDSYACLGIITQVDKPLAVRLLKHNGMASFNVGNKRNSSQ
jgi:hypothetical protein